MSKKTAPAFTVLSVLHDFDGTRLVSLQHATDPDTTRSVRLQPDEAPELTEGDAYAPAEG